VARLRTSTLPLSLNVLMLYGNMEQLMKLRVPIVALLAWIDCSSEFIIKNIKNTSKFVEYFKCILNYIFKKDQKINAPLVMC
jgi:hypothetical protein